MSITGHHSAATDAPSGRCVQPYTGMGATVEAIWRSVTSMESSATTVVSVAAGSSGERLGHGAAGQVDGRHQQTDQRRAAYAHDAVSSAPSYACHRSPRLVVCRRSDSTTANTGWAYDFGCSLETRIDSRGSVPSDLGRPPTRAGDSPEVSDKRRRSDEPDELPLAHLHHCTMQTGRIDLGARVGNHDVVHPHAALLDQPARLAIRRGELERGQQTSATTPCRSARPQRASQPRG